MGEFNFLLKTIQIEIHILFNSLNRFLSVYKTHCRHVICNNKNQCLVGMFLDSIEVVNLYADCQGLSISHNVLARRSFRFPIEDFRLLTLA